MARIKGVDIPNNKRIKISLTYIYGVGSKIAADILDAVRNKCGSDKYLWEEADEEFVKPYGEIKSSYLVRINGNYD